MNNINLGNYGENTDYDHELFINLNKYNQSRQPEIQSNHKTRYVLFGMSKASHNDNYISISHTQKTDALNKSANRQKSIEILNL